MPAKARLEMSPVLVVEPQRQAMSLSSLKAMSEVGPLSSS